MPREYRVVWKRVDGKRTVKKYRRHDCAVAYMQALQGDPSEMARLYGLGPSITESKHYKDPETLEYVELEQREVGKWTECQY